MKLITNTIVAILLISTLSSCGSKNNKSDENNVSSKTENKTKSKSKDDGSGKVFKRMGIKEPRSMKYQPNDFHLGHVNQILFTDNINLNPEKASKKDFKTDFKAGEVIKGIAYLDKTAAEQFGQNGFPILKYSVGNRNHKWEIESYRKYDQSLTFLEFFISVPVEQYIPTKGGASTIANSMEELSLLDNKKYELNAELYTTNESKTNILGAINYDASSKKNTKKLADEIKQIRIKHVSSTPQPKANMHEPKIEAQLVNHFNKMGWEEEFFKTIILSDEFYYKKSYAGIIVARTLSVAMVSKKEEGFCMYQDFTVISDKTDNGYSKFKRYSTGGQKGCSCK